MAVAVALVALRRRLGRGPLAAAGFFVVTLAPVLGFLDVYPMRYSFVADHFQYHAAIGLIVLLVSAGATGLHRLRLGAGSSRRPSAASRRASNSTTT